MGVASRSFVLPMFQLILISELFFILPLAVGLNRIGNMPKAFRLTYSFILAITATWVLGMIGERVARNNLFIFHYYSFFEFSFYLLAFQQLLQLRKLYFYLLGISFGAVFLLDALFLNGITKDINLYSNTFGNIILLTLSLFSLYRISENITIPLHSKASFWFSIAVLFYTSSSTLLYIMAALYPSKSNDLFIYFPFINLIYMGLLTRMYLCFALSTVPRRALPRWLRFRLGWRPPTQPPQYRVLPSHLIK